MIRNYQKFIKFDHLILTQTKYKMQKQFKSKCLGISMIVCKNPITKKYLVIQQIDSSWWIPGGRVDAPETFKQAGKRQCKEQAGIDVQIKGILRMEHNFYGSFVRLKSILYAEPIDPYQQPKSKADKQSIQGKYLTIEQILQLKKVWRDPSIYIWPKYIEDGGKIYPNQILQEQSILK